MYFYVNKYQLSASSTLVAFEATTMTHYLTLFFLEVCKDSLKSPRLSMTVVFLKKICRTDIYREHFHGWICLEKSVVLLKKFVQIRVKILREFQ